MELPPRGIEDILAEIDRARVEAQRRLDKVRAVADAEPSPSLSGRALASFYNRRADHAERLGRSQQTINDFERAIEAGEAEPSYTPFHIASHRASLGSAMIRVGSFAAGVERLRTATLQLREMDPSRNPFVRGHRVGRLAAFESMLGSSFSEVGDVANANNALEQAGEYISELDGLISLAQRENVSLGDDTLSGVAISNSLYLAALAKSAEQDGDLDRAESLLRRSLLRQADVKSEIEGFSLDQLKATEILVRSELVPILLKQRLPNAAELEARRAIRLAIETRGMLDARAAVAMSRLIEVLLQEDRFADAEKLASINADSLSTMGADPSSSLVVRNSLQLAAARAGQRKWKAAARNYVGLDGIANDSASSLSYAVVSDPVRSLVFYKAEEWFAALSAATTYAEWIEAVRSTDSFGAYEARAFLAATRWRVDGDGVRALSDLREALTGLIAAGGDADWTSSLSRMRLEVVIQSFVRISNAGSIPERDVENLFRLAEIIKGGVLSDTIAASGARQGFQGSELGDLIRQQQDLSQQLEGLYSALSKANATGFASTADADALRERAAQIKEAERLVSERIGLEYPDYDSLRRPSPPTFSELRTRLGPDRVMVSILTTDDATFAWAVSSRAGAGFVETGIGSDELRALVRRVRRSVDPGPISTLGEVPPFDTRVAYQLYQRILEPLESVWRPSSELIISTNGPMATLPFGLLPTEPPQEPSPSELLFDEYRQVAWLIKSHAVSNLPSAATLLVFDRGPSSQKERRPFVGFGDPYFSPAHAAAEDGTAVADLSVRGFQLRNAPLTRQADGAGLDDLPRLADTRDEILAVASAMGADPERDIFLGKRASESQVKRMNLSVYNVVSFATHGLVAGDLDGLDQPALALSAPQVTREQKEDGLLTMEEILALKLDADFAVLSACNTAAADGRGSEAVSGLGRAFFYAGARALLVSNWPVHSAATTDQMGKLFTTISASPGVSRADALRGAKLAQIENGVFSVGGTPAFSFAHPIFWAPFSLIGDSGSDRVALN